MRRTDREITDPVKITKIITTSHCCRLGFSDNGSVYIVPLSFGHEEVGGKHVFYFHSAREGRKVNLIGAGTRVGFELDTGYQLKAADIACGFSASFQSVIGTGWISPVKDEAEKRHGLRCLMEHLSGNPEWDFSREMMDRIAVFKMEAEALSCKEHP